MHTPLICEAESGQGCYCVVVGEVPEGRKGSSWQGVGSYTGSLEQRTVEGQMGGPSILLGNRTVARSWRGEGSMFQEIAEIIQQGPKIRGLSSRCIAVYF